LRFVNFIIDEHYDDDDDYLSCQVAYLTFCSGRMLTALALALASEPIRWAFRPRSSDLGLAYISDIVVYNAAVVYSAVTSASAVWHIAPLCVLQCRPYVCNVTCCKRSHKSLKIS